MRGRVVTPKTFCISPWPTGTGPGAYAGVHLEKVPLSTTASLRTKGLRSPHRLSSHKRSIRSYCQNAVYQVSSYSRLLLTSLFSTVASMAEVAQTTTVSISLAASGVSVSRTTTQTSRQTSIYTSQDRSVPRSAATMGCYASRCCQCGTMLVISDSCIDCRHKQCQTCEPRY